MIVMDAWAVFELILGLFAYVMFSITYFSKRETSLEQIKQLIFWAMIIITLN